MSWVSTGNMKMRIEKGGDREIFGGRKGSGYRARGLKNKSKNVYR